LDASGAHLLFLPDAVPRVFLWGPRATSHALATKGVAERVACVTDKGKVEKVAGFAIGLGAALPELAAFSVADAERLPSSLAAWSLAAKFGLDLVARGRLVPAIRPVEERHEARWRVSLALPDDARRFAQLVAALPLSAHALPIATPARSHRARSADAAQEVLQVWAPDALLEAFLHATADTLARAATSQRHAHAAAWETRWKAALLADDAAFASSGFGERFLLEDLRRWAKPLSGAQPGETRVCLRLELPPTASDPPAGRQRDFQLRFLLQALTDPSLLVAAPDVYRGRLAAIQGVRGMRKAQEDLLTGLATAGRLFAPVAESLRGARPESVALTPTEAWQFIETAAPQFIEAGLGVILPAELTRAGQRRLRMRMRIGGERKASSAASDAQTGLESLVHFQWRAELAGETLSQKDLHELAQLKAPLVQFRGRWVAVDAAEIREALRLLEKPEGAFASHEALSAALGIAHGIDTSLPVEVEASGAFAETIERLQSASRAVECVPPAGFTGTLRPYQLRGLSWLATMADLGLGACLADDMGLGKTVQLIALLLRQREAGVDGPVLLVCPTSVVGNWERELARFAPQASVVRHYGALRAREEQSLRGLAPGAIVLTSYGLLRRDAQLLAQIDWSAAVLDEAQNIKNAASRTAQAARSIRATCRVALTGTPVENRLSELWSIFEFLNPRLLGSQAGFRREYAIPIERYGQTEPAERLRRVVQPFIMRRLKSDPAIIQDLPSKQEMKVICSLTREQATLYQAALDEAMRTIDASEGIERRGLVLALLTALKQICNHPAQYLGEMEPLHGRSGKLQRLVEMLEEVVVSGDRALVFTQYREMGERLVSEIRRVLDVDPPFLHGAVPRAKRDAMVERFQSDSKSSPIFVLSLKAGGTGLNLTGANHVFHFDRWWNPAVEDQATDRAYRIGQFRQVQVHKFLCAGTVEDKVDEMLERKRDLAARIVGDGEHWITELDNTQLRELLSLAPDAVVTAEAEDAEDAVSEAQPEAAQRRRRRAGGSR
jgi:hypothetical protein